MRTTLIFVALIAVSSAPKAKPEKKALPPPTRYEFRTWEPGKVKGQLRAPCPDPHILYNVNGLCWGKTTAKPPCPSDEWQHNGGCYIPAVESVEDRRPKS
jgi:hypothetical protein